MTFLAPGWLVISAMASAAVLALHLLNRQRLRPRPFPTARFVPDASVRAVSRTWQPTDPLLLFLRVAILLLSGFALARPVGAPPRHTAIIALADRSPGADSISVDRALAGLKPDTVISMPSLSAGLIASRRAGARRAGRADSVDLVVVSSMSAGLWDAATTALRATWPGTIRLVQTGRRADGQTDVEIDAAPDHPFRAAVARLGVKATGGPVVIRWPTPAPTSDTAYGVYAAGIAMVGTFPKAQGAPRTAHGTAIAWFADGSPAVVEYPTALGCERVVGFASDAGDGLLRGAGLHIAERLTAPCGAGWTPDRYQAADSSAVADLAGSGHLAATRALPRDELPSIAPTPLLLALAALVAERVIRRRAA